MSKPTEDAITCARGIMQRNTMAFARQMIPRGNNLGFQQGQRFERISWTLVEKELDLLRESRLRRDSDEIPLM